MVSEFNPWEEAAGAAAQAAGAAAGALPPRPADDEPPPDETGEETPPEEAPPEEEAVEGKGRRGFVRSQGDRPRDNGQDDNFVPQSQDDARWAGAFANEHDGKGPKYEDYYDRLWSIGFARQQDRSPTMNDWRAHYYVKYDDNEPDRAVNRVRYETRDFEWEPAQPLAVYQDKHGPWDVDRPKAKEKAPTAKAGGAGGAGGGGGLVKAATPKPLYRGSFGEPTRSTPALDEMMGPTLPIPTAPMFPVQRGATPLSDWERGDPGSTGMRSYGTTPNAAWPHPVLTGVPFSTQRAAGVNAPDSYDPRSGMPLPRAYGPFDNYLSTPTAAFDEYMGPTAPAPSSVTGMSQGRYFTPLVNLNQGVDAWRDELMRNLFGR